MLPVNAQRLADTFVALCEIESPSRQEGRLAAHLTALFRDQLNPDAIIEDDSAGRTGSDCGNLIIRFDGDPRRIPLFFNCHLDTVTPCQGVKVRFDGIAFSSAGDTILGADDKAGIAMLIEMMRVLHETATPHCPMELIFTTCEEIGLLGAKHLAYDKIRARMGLALDSAGIDRVVVGAPAANRFQLEIHGIAAHAGLHPEQGISAIQLAARAMADLPLGRLDAESTANLGLISGGTATNIIPDRVRIDGEVRSHNPEKLTRHTCAIEARFRDTIAAWTDPTGQATGSPSLTWSVSQEYPAVSLTADAPLLQLLQGAAGRINRPLALLVSGGGSDANIFNGHGLETAILGIGMTKVHTTDETITLNDMIRTTELLISTATY
ncbi:MAG: M20/M25/M40 family metallo-hydrolase [Desulfobulbaceae bacterium]|nr:M20/M25/M40 family metallo-hydrolase [Desulfobulbaceae bacterium]